MVSRVISDNSLSTWVGSFSLVIAVFIIIITPTVNNNINNNNNNNNVAFSSPSSSESSLSPTSTTAPDFTRSILHKYTLSEGCGAGVDAESRARVIVVIGTESDLAFYKDVFGETCGDKKIKKEQQLPNTVFRRYDSVSELFSKEQNGEAAVDIILDTTSCDGSDATLTKVVVSSKVLRPGGFIALRGTKSKAQIELIQDLNTDIHRLYFDNHLLAIRRHTPRLDLVVWVRSLEVGQGEVVIHKRLHKLDPAVRAD